MPEVADKIATLASDGKTKEAEAIIREAWGDPERRRAASAAQMAAIDELGFQADEAQEELIDSGRVRARAGGAFAVHDGQGELVDIVDTHREAFALAAEVLEREEAIAEQELERQRQAEEQRVREEQVRAEQQEKVAPMQAEVQEAQAAEQGGTTPQTRKRAQKAFIKHWDSWPKEVRGQFAVLHGFKSGFSKRFEKLDAQLQHGLLKTALEVDAAARAWNKASVEQRKHIATEGGIAPYSLATHLSDLPSKRWEDINPNLWGKLTMGHHIRAERREEAAAIRKDNKLRIENLSDDALWDLMQEGGTEAVRKAAERELNKRMQREAEAEAAGDYEDLLSVLRKIKLPTKDGGLQAELDMLQKEGVNFGTRTHLFDKRQKSLDRVAEILRVDYGFGQIQTPDDVITFTQRALSGEKIMPRLEVSELRLMGRPTRPSSKELGRPQAGASNALAEGYERFFHGSKEGLEQIEDDGLFGGIFVSANYDAARSHGEQVFVVDVKAEQVASKWDIINAPAEVLDKVYTRMVGKDWKQHEAVLEALVEEDGSAFDYGDDEAVLDALGGDDLGEASFEAQKIRGQIAKELGFKAVPMNDEHGTSYLILPGAEVRSERALKGQQVRKDLSVTEAGVSKADAAEELGKLRGKLLRNDETGIEAQINTNQAGKLLSNTAARKSENNGFTREQHNALVANIANLWRHAIQMSEHIDERSGDGRTTIKRFAVPVLIGGELKHATILVKERTESGHRIYTLEAIQKETLQGALGNSFAGNGSKLTPLEALPEERLRALEAVVNGQEATEPSNSDAELASPLQLRQPNAAKTSLAGTEETKGKKPVSAPEVLEAIAKVAQAVGRDKRSVNRVGHLSSKRTLGTYNEGSRITRIRTANDTTTAAHELAHLIDDALWGRDFWKKKGLPLGDPIMLGQGHWKSNALGLADGPRGELRTLGEQLYTEGEPHNGYHSEGFAEFVRLWLTDTKQAKAKAPQFAKFWEEEVLAQHPKLAGAVEQAKAAGTTALTSGQWQQVHTPEFKAWFGDWETARAQARIDAMEPVELALDEKWRGASVEELRGAVVEHLRELAKTGVKANHPELGEVGFSRNKTGKIVSTSAAPEKLHATLEIVRVIEAAHLVESVDSYKEGEARVGILYHTLGAKVNAFGREFVSVITVQQSKEGSLFYNNIALESGQKEAPVAYPREQQSEDSGSPSAFTGAAQSKLAPLRRVNAEEVSKAIDPQTGEPLVVYHGTARPDRVGTVFDPERATSGPMAYFTDNSEVASNYSQNKADTSLGFVPDLAEQFRFRVGKGEDAQTVSIVEAWKHLSAREKQRITKAIYTVGYEDADAMEGAIVANSESVADKQHLDFVLREKQGNALEALVEVWLMDGTLYNEEARFLEVLEAVGLDKSRVFWEDPYAVKSAVYPVYLSMKNPLDTAAIKEDILAALEEAGLDAPVAKEFGQGVDPWAKDAFSAEDWIKSLREDMEKGTTYTWTRVPDWVTDALRELGYDGVKDTGGKQGGVDHGVWIPFDSTQVKSATGNCGSFDGGNPDITYQLRSVDGQREGRVNEGMSEEPLSPEERAQLLEHQKFLMGEPVAQLTGEEFAKTDSPLTERVPQWYSENGFSEVNVEGVGTVLLDKTSVRNTISHGLSRSKSAAFAAVPDVLLQGLIIYQEPLKGGGRGRLHHIAAPVQIADKVYVMDVLVKDDANVKRMYVHEVFIRNRLHEPAFKTGAIAAGGAGERARAGNGAVANVLRRIFSVKEDEAPSPADSPLALRTLPQLMRRARGSDQAKEAAKAFIGKPLTNAETGVTAVVSGESFKKILSESSVTQSVSQQAHHEAAANLDSLFRLATHRLSRPDKRGSPSIKALHHFDAPMPFEEEALRVKMLVKELTNPKQNNTLYTLAVVEIEKPSAGGVKESGEYTEGGSGSTGRPEGFGEKFAAMVEEVKRGMREARSPADSATHQLRSVDWEGFEWNRFRKSAKVEKRQKFEASGVPQSLDDELEARIERIRARQLGEEQLSAAAQPVAAATREATAFLRTLSVVPRNRARGGNASLGSYCPF